MSLPIVFRPLHFFHLVSRYSRLYTSSRYSYANIQWHKHLEADLFGRFSHYVRDSVDAGYINDRVQCITKLETGKTPGLYN